MKNKNAKEGKKTCNRNDSLDYGKFQNLKFSDFQMLASTKNVDEYERIGFPSSYRKGFERNILNDIKGKVNAFNHRGSTLLDIGCGAGPLTLLEAKECYKNSSHLILVDSREMLSHVPDEFGVEKIYGRFQDCADQLERHRGKIQGILAYSVIQHVFLESNIFSFIDSALDLLSPGGEMLIGDIPNISKRKRFFASAAGIDFHKKFTGGDQPPKIVFNRLELHKIDDGVVFGILSRYRSAGYDTYLLPQSASLPMSNRREDILIRKL
ncbi:MAG: methyltransferase domain-containing protein [Candidatus Thermoplasmatota archaeon]|jgi:2-polyprenyl-3-methyl-5-hydroxy-6-metoxy-1,4-benzoquinol methylase|nr:methyltransferase domain-containing protein [Candidatus Thermoplasmatota archaeon]